jgi:hypothetical protein
MGIHDPEDLEKASVLEKNRREIGLEVGDRVGYLSVLGDRDFTAIGKVRSVHPEAGMVMIEGKAGTGAVLASHCVYLGEEEKPPSLEDAIRPALCNSSWCSCRSEKIADAVREFLKKRAGEL